MQRQIYLFFLLYVAVTPVDGLKLLVDYVEDDDETWESDISFSYKPFKGACCKNANGVGGVPDKTPNSPPDGYQGEGNLAMFACEAVDSNGGVVTAADALKYCEKVEGSAGAKYNTIQGALKDGPKFKSKSSVAKFVHYAAKLATMSNAALKANSDTHFIKAMTVNTASYATEFYKGVALAGDSTPTANIFCYVAAGISWAKNDPMVKNMDGEEFEITATGTFSLLTLKAPHSGTMFEASATIDRAGTRCGATYIQNMTLRGQWVEDIGVPRIQIKAEAAVPKAKALQVNFNGEWQHTASHLSYAAVRHANAYKLNLKLHDLDVTVSLDSHRIHEEGTRTSRFANFLNANFGGVSGLSGLSMGGLLGKDSHQDATELPEGCEPNRLLNEDGAQKMWSELEVS